MYAAAGGASIANRRKQKRLQLNKREVSNLPGIPSAVSARKKATSATKSRSPITNEFARASPHVQHDQSQRIKAQSARSAARPITALQSQSRPIERRRRRRQRFPPIASVQFPPITNIQFPISPPPLSLDSNNSGNTVLCGNNKSTHFSFSIIDPPSILDPSSKPSSILDLKLSPTASDLQCGGQGPGKAAWQSCSRFPQNSPLPLSPVSPHRCQDGYNKTKQCEAHRRWMKRNRIRDASYCYGSSADEDEDSELGQAGRRRDEFTSSAVNTILYAGLGTTCLGLVISFVGTGEKGFLSPELRLVGPSLLCAGLLCCFFRVLLCLCFCRCGDCRWRNCMASQKRDKKEKKEKQEKLRGGNAPLPSTNLLSPLQRPERDQQQVHLQRERETQLQRERLQQEQQRELLQRERQQHQQHYQQTQQRHELLLSPAQLSE